MAYHSAVLNALEGVSLKDSAVDYDGTGKVPVQINIGGISCLGMCPKLGKGRGNGVVNKLAVQVQILAKAIYGKTGVMQQLTGDKRFSVLRYNTLYRNENFKQIFLANIKLRDEALD